MERRFKSAAKKKSSFRGGDSGARKNEYNIFLLLLINMVSMRK